MKHLIIFLAYLFTFSACTDKKSNNPIDAEPSVEKLSTAISEFGIKALDNLGDDEENILISPLSIHTALAMTLQGADNNTLDQMISTLEVDNLSKEEISVSYKQLFLDLQSTNDSTELSVNNALALDNSRIELTKEFLNLVDEGFSNEELSLDFDDEESALKSINDWAANATNQRITEILTDIKPEEVMFIINALYFIGDWQVGFPEFAINEGDFTLNDGKKVKADLMLSDTERASYIGDSFSAVDLPFKGEEYSMTYIINDSAPTDFIKSLANTDFTEWYSDLISNKIKKQRTLVILPKHEIYTKNKLKETLQTLGMTDAFGNADFTSMGSSTLGALFLSRVLHDAYIKVDEKGVEGAAVTTVSVGVTSVPPTVNMNKPFFFVLRHIESGVPIFMGIVNDPRS